MRLHFIRGKKYGLSRWYCKTSQESRQPSEPIVIIIKKMDNPKAMFLFFTDGVSQFLLDFSLHGEEGKWSDKPQGLSKKQAKARYSKEHSDDERITKRTAEYLASKIETAISMLKRSIIEGIRFDYLLVDSWFTCTELLKFVVSRHFGCHLIGMIKMARPSMRSISEPRLHLNLSRLFKNLRV